MYRLYLIDFDGQYIELDVEELDFGVEFKISSLSDLSFRSGNRTKEVTLKGTDVNNNAFGYIYKLGRSTNIDLDNKLFFNYNSLRQVDCLVYHSSDLLFRGTLRLIETVKIKGVIYYKVVLTDSVIDVMKFTQDKVLTDIDFTYLKHQYTIDTITQSWANQTQRWDGTTFSYTPYEKGSGYVYGYAYYGVQPSTQSEANISLYNYRPSIYVKEILNSIFNQDGLDGYSWEIKGDNEFINKFNSLVIPNSQDALSTISSNFQETIYRCSGTAFEYEYLMNGVRVLPVKYYLLNMPCKSATGSNNSISILNSYATSSAIYSISSNVECDAYAKIDYTLLLSATHSTTIQFYFAKTREKYSGEEWNAGGHVGFWTETYASKSLTFGPSAGGPTINGVFESYIPKRNWVANSLIGAFVKVRDNAFTSRLINATASFTLPYVKTSEVKIDINYGNPLTPSLEPTGSKIKQFDFIKSLMLMFNLYAYSEKSRPKHLIFQTYDDFYSSTSLNIIKNIALDWTSKVIYSEDFKKMYNLNIPKRYIYTYKSDKDFINTNYQDSVNGIYGQLKFSDEYGVIDEQKVEVMFSPSPMVKDGDLRYTLIRGGDSEQVKTTTSNIRILFYNGVYPFIGTQYGYGTYSTSLISNYGEMVEYYRGNSFDEDSLQFGNPVKFYFPVAGFYTTLPNLYSTYYINRVSELTDVDLHTMECKMILTNVDIATFDFRVPIYISTDMGNSYYKVLEISWKDERTPATVRLQSINISKV